MAFACLFVARIVVAPFFLGGVFDDVCSPVMLPFFCFFFVLGGLNVVVLSLVFVRFARYVGVVFEGVFVWGGD